MTAAGPEPPAGVLTLEHDFSGPFRSGAWTARCPGTGQELRLEGREAAMLTLLLAGRRLRENLHPLDAVEGGRKLLAAVPDLILYGTRGRPSGGFLHG